jgi:hypothetical protein
LAPTEIVEIQQRFKATLRFDISTSYIIPFAIIDQTLRSLEVAGILVFRLESPEYRFRDPRYPFVNSFAEPDLFYSVLVNEQSDLIQLVGADPGVTPPKFNVDITRLSELIPVAAGTPRIFFFTMFVDEKGTILAVESQDQETKDAVNALKQVPVLVPGRRENVNVPTAVLVAIPKK